MFPFQQGDELFQIPSTTHPDYNNINIFQQQNQQDPPYHNNNNNNLIPMATTPAPTASTIHQAPPHHSCTTRRHRKSTLIPVSKEHTASSSVAAAVVEDHDDIIRNESDRRKEAHREIERQRRQAMSNLYSSLRSQLPLEYLKGKRSISDHMNEAVSYIKHLENIIMKMSLKRDELKSKLPNEATKNSPFSSSSSRISTFVQVSPCWGGVEIVITSGFRDHKTPPLPISNVLYTLQEDGFIVFGYVSAIVNENVVYTIRAQVGEDTWLDTPCLQEKLLGVLG